MKKSICIFVALSTLAGVKSHAQQAFSLVGINKMLVDPAFTGIDTSFKNEASIYAEAAKMNTTISPAPDVTNDSYIGTY